VWQRLVLPVHASHRRGLVRTAPRGVAASTSKGSEQKLSSDLSGPATRISFLKASLKNLVCCFRMFDSFNPLAQGSCESLAKLLRRRFLLLCWRWLRCSVIHLPRGIVEDFLCFGVVILFLSFLLYLWTRRNLVLMLGAVVLVLVRFFKINRTTRVFV
jgi:hypothetical protein